MSNFVLDTTVTRAWCFPGEATPLSGAILGRLSNLTDTASVPALWLYPFVNATGLAVREGRISDQKAQQFRTILAGMPIGIESPTRNQVWNAVRPLATVDRLTGYDAACLELAMRLNLPIAPFDKALGAATRIALVEALDG